MTCHDIAKTVHYHPPTVCAGNAINYDASLMRFPLNGWHRLVYEAAACQTSTVHINWLLLLPCTVPHTITVKKHWLSYQLLPLVVLARQLSERVC